VPSDLSRRYSARLLSCAHVGIICIHGQQLNGLFVATAEELRSRVQISVVLTSQWPRSRVARSARTASTSGAPIVRGGTNEAPYPEEDQIVGDFTAALRMNDGGWRVVRPPSR